MAPIVKFILKFIYFSLLLACIAVSTLATYFLIPLLDYHPADASVPIAVGQNIYELEVVGNGLAEMAADYKLDHEYSIELTIDGEPSAYTYNNYAEELIVSSSSAQIEWEVWKNNHLVDQGHKNTFTFFRTYTDHVQQSDAVTKLHCEDTTTCVVKMKLIDFPEKAYSRKPSFDLKTDDMLSKNVLVGGALTLGILVLAGGFFTVLILPLIIWKLWQKWKKHRKIKKV